MGYRGYYLDQDLGFFYLQSRYYVPTWHRFFNADLPEYAKMQKNDHNGTNLFAYCGNDPVNNVDYEGYKYLPSQSFMYKGTTPPKDFGKQKLSESGITMLKACESFSSKAYIAGNSEKHYTIGYGLLDQM